MGVTVVEAESWAELHELWGRLEMMKTGLGGWIITAASMPPGSPEARDAAAHIYAATEEALEVRERIKALSSGPVLVPPLPDDEDEVPAAPVRLCPKETPPLVAPTSPAPVGPVRPAGEITARLVRRLRSLPAHRADG